MPRLAFKPDASFFEKIAIGAVGARAVSQYLSSRGHDVAELENGSTATKLWKDVKRKRVRIPDLVCKRCGLRVESRAKSNQPELSVSHSETDAERAWDYGLVDADVMAFPVCSRVGGESWGSGRLEGTRSYWHSRDRVNWSASAYINFFRVADLRAVTHGRSSTKGVTEGSETSITWDAIFSTRAGRVESVDRGKISVRRQTDGHLYPWQNKKGLATAVEVGQEIAEHQLLAGAVRPVADADLRCLGALPNGHILSLLESPQRTQRFTGVKLARLRGESAYRDRIARLGAHDEEDIYVRLEAAAFLTSACAGPARELFDPYLSSPDDQIRLEAVVALAAAGTGEAVRLLGDILKDAELPYFLRSASAWGLGQIASDDAAEQLISAFANAGRDVRDDALDAVGTLGTRPYGRLTAAILGGNDDLAAGAAEAIRRYSHLPETELRELVESLKGQPEQMWVVWLLAHLPRGVAHVDAAVADLQDENPQAHFAISVIWTFLRSWVAPRWELFPEA